MERFCKRLLLALTAAMMTLNFSACGDDKDESGNSSNSVVGTWYQENSAGTKITLVFKSNQTGSIKYEYKSGSDMTEYFEYNIQTDRDGDTFLFITSDDCQLEGRYYVLITPSTLTLDSWSDSSVYQFKRK